MIQFLKGKIAFLNTSSVTMDCNHIGYEVFISFQTFQELQAILKNSEITIFTYHHITERSQKLFGFASIEEKNLFLLLRNWDGIGESMALRILSFFNASQLLQIGRDGDKKVFEKVPGIGQKTAGRILFSIQENTQKLETLTSDRPKEKMDSQSTEKESAIEALVSLGFDSKQIEKKVSHWIQKGISTSNEIVKQILREE